MELTTNEIYQLIKFSLKNNQKSWKKINSFGQFSCFINDDYNIKIKIYDKSIFGFIDIKVYNLENKYKNLNKNFRILNEKEIEIKFNTLQKFTIFNLCKKLMKKTTKTYNIKIDKSTKRNIILNKILNENN